MTEEKHVPVEVIRNEGGSNTVRLTKACPVCGNDPRGIRFYGDWGGKRTAECRGCGTEFELCAKVEVKGVDD